MMSLFQKDLYYDYLLLQNKLKYRVSRKSWSKRKDTKRWGNFWNIAEVALFYEKSFLVNLMDSPSE